MTDPIAAWALAAMISRAPPERYAVAQAAFGGGETVEERTDRYRSFADDLARAVRHERPLFEGRRARALTAGVLLGVAWHESGFARDADVGPCRADGPHRLRCDGGRAACALQVLGSPYTTGELFADRGKCFAAAITKIRGSWRTCAKLDARFRFAVWNAGSCTHPLGQRRSEQISRSVQRFLDFRPLPPPDEEPAS